MHLLSNVNVTDLGLSQLCEVEKLLLKTVDKIIKMELSYFDSISFTQTCVDKASISKCLLNLLLCLL